MRTNFATAIPSNTSNSAPMRCEDTWNSCCRCNDRDPRSSTTATTSVNGHLMLAVVMRLPSRAFVPAYIRPQFCRGRGPFRWAALSGDPNDIKVTDQALLELFPEDESLRRWLEAAEERWPSKDSRLEFVGSVSASETRREDCSINWWPKAKSPPPSSLAAITLTAAPWLPPTGKPKQCLMAPMPPGLATVELCHQHRFRSVVGLVPPWWRRGHRLQPTRRPGDCGRRHGSG